MAFTGKPGVLTSVQILGLIHSTKQIKYLKIQTPNTLWCLKAKNNKLVAIGGDPLGYDIEDILISRGLLKVQVLKNINDSAVQEKGLEQVLLSDGHITAEQAEQSVFHLCEAAFFEFLNETSGEFEWTDSACLKVYDLDPSFSNLINEAAPDLAFLKKFRSHFRDFDTRLFWITPTKASSLPKEMELKEIQVLSRYRPSITIRSFWKSLENSIYSTSEMVVILSEKNILSFDPPGSRKLPNSKPFLRALLAHVVDQLLQLQKLMGSGSEMMEILQSINNNLEKMPNYATSSLRSEELGDLSSLTGSLDGLLDLNGVEELNLQQEIETESNKTESKKKPKKNASSRGVKSGVRRQPVKSEKKSKINDETITRNMKPNPKRVEEALAIIEASKNILSDGVSLEEKVDAKVRYRKFTSEVNMSFNRFTMIKQTLFEVFGLVASADRKTIHKAFVKTINTINPKGIQFRKLDLSFLERAIFLRDEYKKIYITLMDDTKKRAYIDSMHAGRQTAEANKTKAMQLFNQGMEKIRAGRYDEAREIFKRAAKYDPNSPVYYTVLEDIDKEEREGNAVKFFQAGILAFKQKNDFKRAIKLIRKALTLRPLDPTYHLKLAEIQAMSGEHREDALVSYLNALELDPGNQELRLLIANFMKNLGKKQDAANMLDVILKWNPDHSIVKKHLLELKKEGITPVQIETDKKSEEKEQTLNEEFE
ncbi:tetratricopeptide repeat protein [bacterium]|nr:tetratricopeptide repeat protein [bacterium]